MSLRPLLVQGLVKASSTEELAPEENLSIAFALDAGYLMPFKVMLASMAKVGTLLDCPLVVYSDDEKLFEDPIVQLVTDKRVLLSGARKDRLHQLARDSVLRQERRGNWNRGTFLKWAVFEPQPTPNLLFLDVDMVVLRPLEGMTALAPHASLLTAPQFQTALVEETPAVINEALQAMVHGTGFPGRHSWRINSGMMLIREPLLRTDFFEELAAFATAKQRVHEQAHLSEYFHEHPGHVMIPAAYNCQEQWVRKLTAKDRKALLKEVKVLHYAGSNKPWKKPEFAQVADARRYWHQAAKSACAMGVSREDRRPPASKPKSTKTAAQHKGTSHRKGTGQRKGKQQPPRSWLGRAVRRLRQLIRNVGGI